VMKTLLVLSEDRLKGGRPPRDGLLMAKILILQELYSIKDDSMEFQIEDRASFRRFLGLSPDDRSPDAKTIWLWRNRIVKSDLIEKIMAWFYGVIDEAGFRATKGTAQPH
jgi:transposase, IS5 family